jgi:predicted CoA-binding protein
MIMKTVVILGASENPERYSNKAFRILKERHYDIVPVNPSLDVLDEIPVVHSLSEAPRNPDVLTVYVNPLRSAELVGDILALAPKVVIFNPGAENPALGLRLHQAGIKTVNACSVVLLTTGRFEEATTPEKREI